jgi:hypothetical protein
MLKLRTFKSDSDIVYIIPGVRFTGNIARDVARIEENDELADFLWGDLQSSEGISDSARRIIYWGADVQDHVNRDHLTHNRDGLRGPTRDVKLDAFTRAYLEAALWSSYDDEDDDDEPLDRNYGIEDIDISAIKKAIDDVASFQDAAGFWDRNYPKSLGDRLTEIAHAYGEINFYIGDDNQTMPLHSRCQLQLYDPGQGCPTAHLSR